MYSSSQPVVRRLLRRTGWYAVRQDGLQVVVVSLRGLHQLPVVMPMP